jgi:mannose-6-phosphate isomerase-like protein (cupin superfamily)
MRALPIGVILTLLSAATLAAQPSAASITMFASSDDVKALIAQARSERKDQPTISKPILRLAPYNANLEYRASVGPAAVHEHEAEMFYVIDGTATLTTGGKLVNEKRTNAENLSGTGIEGGSAQKVAKGDFIIVPENTPHWFGSIDGTLILMSLHVPRPVGH